MILDSNKCFKRGKRKWNVAWYFEDESSSS